MSVHLLVLIHGMWGNPDHLSELKRIITETYASSSDGIQLEVLVAEKNRDFTTFDGIDWGGERVAKEVFDRVEELKKDGRTVSKFSVTGYSLGGLVARYVVGILHQRGFFENVAPVNFNTVATPHIGLPRYPSFFSALTSSLGPKLLSRTGEQFYLADKWSATGRPLIEVMADPDRVFYQALQRFQHVRIYANAVQDLTVPYVTAAIEIEDPFALHEKNGLEVEFEEEYYGLMKSYSIPAIPPAPTPKPIMLSGEWFRTRKGLPLPPRLQKPFPLNLVVYAFLPVLIPAFISLVIVRFSLETRSSRARIRLLEEDKTNTQKLIDILAELEQEGEDAVVQLLSDDAPGLEQGESVSTPTVTKTKTNKRNHEQNLGQPILTPLQVKIAGWLNQLPLQKKLAFFPDVRNSHAMIVSRDVKQFQFHRRGEAVIRHWASSFIL
ncbi:hypothetical protein H0H92_006924 [Tricholoma furcatifolium]|nr:hypothetical protein H0H92_006924 [Tricholoma furcatifolium]